ncbi:hypothetical protein HIM_01010 [Hirsutella minnesotensis 3608]|nr:hypothetical protein HIM_01010 [Hirsutella minnesotensis 3608]
MMSCASPRRLAIGCLVALAAIAAASPSPASLDDGKGSMVAREESASSLNPIPKLHVTLRQTSSSPPTVRVAVTNGNKFPVTIVDYQSPLDPLALQTGLLSITPAGSSQPLQLRTIQVKRVWPPREDSLPDIKPGATAYNDLVLKEPTVPMEQLGKRAKVILKGRWMAVWPRSRDQISKEELENAASSAFSGEYSSQPLEIQIK